MVLKQHICVMWLLCIGGSQATQVPQWVSVVRGVSTERTLVPVLVIGSGPAGLAAALYTARHKLYTVVLTGNEPGGQLVGSKRVENMPGISADEGYKIMDSLRAQTESFGAKFLDDSLERIEKMSFDKANQGSYFVVTTGSGKIIHALSVIVTTGARAVMLGVPGEQTYLNRGVFTCAVCECRQMAGKDVVIVGGGDASIEAVMYLAPYAKQVTLLVRKDHLRASPAMREKVVGLPHVQVKYCSELVAVYGDSRKVTHVRIKNNVTGEEQELSAQGVFETIGHIPNSAKFSLLVNVNDAGYVLCEGRTQKTSCEGICAAGDVADPMYRQAGVAAGDGIKAGLDTIAYLHERGFSETVAAELEMSYLPV